MTIKWARNSWWAVWPVFRCDYSGRLYVKIARLVIMFGPPLKEEARDG